MSNALALGGTIATGLLIGRDRELDTLFKACTAERADFRCALIRADGGLGKTRLLQEVVERLGGPADPRSSGASRGIWAGDHVVTLPLIDVADPELHTAVLFLRAVCAHLKTLQQLPDRRRFHKLTGLIEEYVQNRASELPAQKLVELQARITELFLELYIQLTQTVRVVWVIDTMEQLITTHAEIEALSREAGIAESLDQLGTYRWLIEFVSRLPNNTTMLLAGRPYPGRWAEDIDDTIDLHRGLSRQSNSEQFVRPLLDDQTPTDRRGDFRISAESIRDEQARAKIALRVEPLTFNESEIVAYLEALQARLLELAEQESSYKLLATYLRRNLLDDPEQLAILSLLTGGNPIRLAIYVELMLNDENNELQLFDSRDEVEALSPDERKALDRKIDSSLLKHLNNHLTTQSTQLVKLLAMMRRGLDPERLAILWNTDLESGRQILKGLQRYSFVKTREETGQSPATGDDLKERFFLHDEFYAMYQQGLISAPEDQLHVQRGQQREFFRQLAEFCSDRFREHMAKIQELDARLLSPERAPAQLGDPNRQEYTRLKIQQRQLRYEELHYELYHDPLHAFFDLYARRVEQALSANAFEYEAQYRSEIDLFFFGSKPENNQLLTGVDPETWNLLRMGVVYDQVSSWVRRLISAGQVAEAEHLAEQAGGNFPRLACNEHGIWLEKARTSAAGQELEELYQLKWRAYGAFAAIFAGKDTSGAIRRLADVAQQLRSRLEVGARQLPEPSQTHFQNLLAQVLLYIGYAYAGLSQFQKARTFYQQAAAIVEHTGFRALRAEIHNDLSRVLGELGDTDRALRYCQEGLNLRAFQGFAYPQALSANTMALINIRDDRSHPEGLEWAGQALARFTWLEQPRGIGLALIQKAEALRRQVNMQVTTRVAAAGPRLYLEDAERTSMVDALQIAEQCLNEASKIFQTKIPETVRQLEVGISQASLYRDWAVLFLDASDDSPEGAEHTRYLDKSLAKLKQVFKICQQSNTTTEDYALYELNALIVRSMVQIQRGDIASAQNDLVQAEGLIPDEYHLVPGRVFQPAEDVREIFFRELSRIAYVRSMLVPRNAPDRDARILEQYALAHQYMQLFTPYNPALTRKTAHNLSNFLSQVRTVSRTRGDAIQRELRNLRERYQLDQLREYLAKRAREYTLPPADMLVIDEFIDAQESFLSR